MLNSLDDFSKKEYSFTFKTAKDNTNIRQRNIEKQLSKLENTENYDKIKSGNYNDSNNKMSRNQANNALKAAAIEVNLKGDKEEELIGAIGKNLYEANDNLNIVAVDVDRQGAQIDKIGDDNADINKIVKLTDKRISSMNRRVWCHKLLLNIMIIVLFMANLIILILKLVRK